MPGQMPVLSAAGSSLSASATAFESRAVATSKSAGTSTSNASLSPSVLDPVAPSFVPNRTAYWVEHCGYPSCLDSELQASAHIFVPSQSEVDSAASASASCGHSVLNASATEFLPDATRARSSTGIWAGTSVKSLDANATEHVPSTPGVQRHDGSPTASSPKSDLNPYAWDYVPGCAPAVPNEESAVLQLDQVCGESPTKESKRGLKRVPRVEADMYQLIQDETSAAPALERAFLCFDRDAFYNIPLDNSPLVDRSFASMESCSQWFKTYFGNLGAFEPLTTGNSDVEVYTKTVDTTVEAVTEEEAKIIHPFSYERLIEMPRYLPTQPPDDCPDSPGSVASELFHWDESPLSSFAADIERIPTPDSPEYLPFLFEFE